MLSGKLLQPEKKSEQCCRSALGNCRILGLSLLLKKYNDVGAALTPSGRGTGGLAAPDSAVSFTASEAYPQSYHTGHSS